MAIITPGDLNTHVYAEIVTEITRGDDTITTRAIEAAIQEAKMYLSRFDLTQLFGTDTTEPTLEDALLKSLIKDLSCWHLFRLANASIDNNINRSFYDDAINTLKNIMNGQLMPEGWPYAPQTTTPAPDGDTISWSSQVKRSNYY